MSEYKENTVGWWLSQFKEPLKSRAFEDCDKQFLNDYIDEVHDRMYQSLQCVWLSTRANKGFWRGTMIYWQSVIKRSIPFAPEWMDCKREYCDDSAKKGWDMAKECAPDNWLKPNDGGEDKAIVDSPAPDVWREKIPLGKIELFTKGMSWDTLKQSLPKGDYVDPSNLTSEEILNLATKPIEIGRKSPMQDWYDQLPPAREIEAPERAVVGYEEPKPIDTIEKKHELRIKNLEAQVIQLEGVVGKLEQQIEYVYRNLPKDFDGTR